MFNAFFLSDLSIFYVQQRANKYLSATGNWKQYAFVYIWCLHKKYKKDRFKNQVFTKISFKCSSLNICSISVDKHTAYQIPIQKRLNKITYMVIVCYALSIIQNNFLGALLRPNCRNCHLHCIIDREKKTHFLQRNKSSTFLKHA